jgi:hypothetical protein
MLACAQFVAALTGALFTGAALYINLVEHPARMACGIEVALAEWRPSYKRAAVVQATLALVSSAAGLTAWGLGAGGLWLAGALTILAVVPFTLLVVAPTNRVLLVPEPRRSAPETRVLLERWARLHAVRTALGLAASATFLALLVATAR